jgi:Ca-activated chloride channel family protein
MIVFDASGSMSGNQTLGIPNSQARIDEVRYALAQVLPSAARLRKVGLVSFGPGPWNQCNVKLNLKPTADAADLIMKEVDSLIPAGKTPLTTAVEQAAAAIDYRNKPGVISFRYQTYSWTGEQSVLEAKCLAEQSGGLYITVDTEQDLVAALEKTLDCPMISQRDLAPPSGLAQR